MKESQYHRFGGHHLALCSKNKTKCKSCHLSEWPLGDSFLPSIYHHQYLNNTAFSLIALGDFDTYCEEHKISWCANNKQLSPLNNPQESLGNRLNHDQFN